MVLAQIDLPTQGVLSTVAGVVAASFFLTEVAKRYISEKTPVIGKIPVLLFPIVISLILTFLCNKVFRDNHGQPFLDGSIWTLLGTAFTSAATTSGFFSWLKNGAVTIGQAQPLGTSSANNTGEDTTMKPNPILLLPLLFLFTGCTSCPQKATLRESMDQATTSIRQDHKDWASKLVAYPVGTTDPRTGKPSTGKNQVDSLPVLTPTQYKAILATHSEYEGLVSDDRAHDADLLGGSTPTK